MGFPQVPDAVLNTSQFLEAAELQKQMLRGKLTFMVTQPSMACSSPSTAASREDLPAPTCPTTASREPWGTLSSMLGGKDQPLTTF